MPRYFFNVENDISTVTDFVGRDLRGEAEARVEGAKAAADLAMSDAIEGRVPTFQWIEIADVEGRPVARLPVGRVILEPSRSR